MKYEFGKAVWMEEPSEKENEEGKEKMRQEVEEKLKASVERLIESRENFLGEGRTAEVHFLEKDRQLCYKIIRKLEVLARPDAVKNLPPRFLEIYNRQKAKSEKEARKTPSQKEETGGKWHVDLFTEAQYLAIAREVALDGPVKVPRPDARLQISGKEEGEGWEVIDTIDILLMETMDADSVTDIIEKGLPLPAGFDLDTFCDDVDGFIAGIHGRKLYHRDLHGGNAMVHRKTGQPVVLDFGRAGISTEEEAYIEEIRPGEKMHFIRDEQMFRDKVKGPLKEYVERSKKA